MLDLAELAAIALGGAFGTLARVGLSQALVTHGWPWATFAENLLGAAMLGYLVTRLQERLPVSTLRRPLLGTGLCAGFTTFSTLQLELLEMIDRHAYGLACAYAAASLAAGYAATFVSSALVRRVRTLA